jgi:alanine dehydrogenase
VRLASEGAERAIRADPGLAQGVNLKDGQVTCRGVAEAHGLRFTPIL